MTTKKKKKKDFKHWVGKAHLWLGLASGLIVLLLGVTGCIFVFNQEITNWLRNDVMYVKEVKAQAIPPTQLWQTTQQAIGKTGTITNISIYNDPQKSTVFHCYKFGEGHLYYYDNIDEYISVYVDQYTGKVLGVYDEELDFFVFIKALHWSLLLNDAIGQTITGWATLIFVIMLITGIILWWPKNKAARKQRLWFQWKDSTKWRRKNYDLHNILGFYVATVAVILAFTGMVWAFTWFQNLVYAAGAMSVTPPEYLVSKSVITENDKDAAFNKACISAFAKHKDADNIRLGRPADSLAPIDIYIGQNEGTYYKSHQMQFDQYTGAFLAERNHSDKNFGEQLITANYDIHVGAILGIPGKILAFIASFISAMLPVTGFIIWYGRTYKKK
ncbi:PepSY domain-containing protein [Flavobacterium sp. Sd200]|uniref:PepSY-associated TM helix domain-containing protein n=1 Tax=Flavobacterium sp. Sd200 TaxID=2692211 RepID=UPI001368D3EF|nr:PepSY-associated TM helix domain-containing protein [Flavobacterium sp. Sd200]MXN91503.1 PepSY domain-containing protein [Flavobacterium sp. Sd200]